MNHRRLAPVCALLLIAAIASEVQGQAPPRRLSMAERISAFGRSLTGGDEEEQEATPAAATTVSDQRSAFPQVDAQSLLPTSRFGSRTSPPTQRMSQPQGQANAESPGASQQSAAGLGQAIRHPAGQVAAPTDPRMATRLQAGSSAGGESIQDHYALPGLGGSPLPSAAGDGAATGFGGLGREVAVGDSAYRSNASGSANDGGQPQVPTAASASSAARNSPQRRAPMYVDPGELRHDLAGAFPAPNAPVALPADSAPDAGATQEFAQAPETVFTLPTNDDPGYQPTAAPSDIASGAESDRDAELDVEPRSPSPAEDANAPVTTFVPSQPASPSPSAGRDAFGESNLSRTSAPNILVTNQAPIISTDIRGPKQIIVGREATFNVRVHNQGNAAAEGIEVTIRVPSWADVIETKSSSGSIGQAPATEIAGALKWQLSRLEAGASESFALRLVPRSSRPLELGVNWTLSPVGSRAIVEVQEPKLELNVSGPDEVLFGKPQIYRFTLSNPGTGVAEDVRIDLYPPGGGEKAAASNPMGNLAPGKSQTIEVELVARDSGKLAIKAQAIAVGDLTATATKEVFCRKPELSIDWRGPEMKYAGTEATYHLRVRNPGTAAAEDVTVRATLPEGSQLVGASEGQFYDAARREIAWRVGSLGPGDDYYMELKCVVSTPGMNQLRLAAATAAGDLTDNKLAETNVIALADLKLEVIDPSGPVAVGEDALYEIRVQNHGAGIAREINIVGLFSAGVEPIHVDGAQYSVSDGRVSFRAIEELPAGRDVVLRIRAQATQPGNHVFRAEVLCRDLEIKLAAEETTRFYANDAGPTGGTTGNQQADASNAFDSAAR